MTNAPPPAPFDITGWKEVAAVFDVHPRTAAKWAASRGLPVCRRFGTTVRARRAELEEWERQQAA